MNPKPSINIDVCHIMFLKGMIKWPKYSKLVSIVVALNHYIISLIRMD
jgi:hypothetical protein